MKQMGLLSAAILVATLSVGTATTYYTSPFGDNAKDGLTPSTAWGTMAYAVSRLKSGDTLIIGEGEYLINEKLPMERAFVLTGTPEAGEDVSKPIVIRAERPHAAIIHSDKPIVGFTKVAGHHFVYCCDAPEDLLQIVESDTDIVYEPAGSITDVDEVVGAYLLDPSTKSLYVHTSDGRPPSDHVLMGITQTTGGGSVMAPPDKPTRSFVIEGLVMKGFSSMALDIRNARNITVRNCVFYHSCYGIYLCNYGRNCRIENNLVFSNNIRRPGSPENAGIMLGGDLEGVVVDGNVARYNRFNNIRLYGATSPSNDVTISNNRCFGDAPSWFKPAPKGCNMIGNVSEGFGGAYLASHNTLPSHTGEYKPQQTEGDLLFGNTAESKAAAKFVDPVGGDYRLQSDSPFRGKGKDGADLGAFPYKDEVFFVRPDGDDAAAGTSVAAAWKNLVKAVERLKAGQTLYVMAGSYEGNLTLTQQGSAKEPIVIRRRGNDRVILDGRGKTKVGCKLDGAAFVRIEGLEFRGFKQTAISANGAKNITIQKCLIHNNAGTGVALQGCHDVSLRDSTIVANTVGVKLDDSSGGFVLLNNILQSNKRAQFEVDALATENYYGNFNCWFGSTLARIGKSDLKSLRDLQSTMRERTGSMQADALFANAAREDFRLTPSSPCRGRGFLERTIGRGDEVPLIAAEAETQDVRVHYVGGTTATISYWTPRHPGYSLLEYQTGNEKPQALSIDFNYRIFHVVCLNGLKPNTTYTFRPGVKYVSQSWIEQTRLMWGQGEAAPANATTFGVSAKFKTLAADPPGRTLHVAADGDDARDGLTASTAWRSLRRASEQAHAGDTVLVGPGRYKETLAPFNSGVSEDRRITFRTVKPREAILDGNNHTVPWAVKLINRDYVTVDGFRMELQTGNDYTMAQTSPYSSQVLLAESHFCTLRNCYLDGGKKFPDPSWAGVFGVWLCDAEGALIDDNFLVKDTFAIVSASGVKPGPGYVWPLVKNNTFLYTYIWTVHMVGGQDRLKLRNNLFAERVRRKASLAYIRIWYAGSRIDSDYNFFYWNNDKPRDMSDCRIIMWHSDLPESDPTLPGGLAAWQKFKGQDTHSLEAFFPSNNIYDNLDFTPAGKPYQGKGEGGADIGCTWIGKHTDQIVFEENPTADIPPWKGK